jgi:hypothetical protein
MLRKSWSFSDGAHWVSSWRRERAETAFEAPSLKRDDDSGLPFEAFSASIDHGSLCLGVRVVIFTKNYHIVQSGIHPSSGLNVVKACNNNVELLIKFLVIVLNRISVRSNFNFRTSFHYKLSSHFSLVLINIMLSDIKIYITNIQIFT